LYDNKLCFVIYVLICKKRKNKNFCKKKKQNCVCANF